jgi:DNA-binding IclR family transcriptional regulator
VNVIGISCVKVNLVERKMARDDRFTTLTPAVEQAAEILRYLASDSSIKAGLTQISKDVKINKSKTHVILNALQKCGFVQRNEESKVYSLGFGLIPIGLTALENVNYKDAAKPFLVELARQTHCSALFGLIVDENLVITEIEQSGQLVESRLRPGHTFPVFYGAHGKAIIASFEEEERRRLFATNKLAFEGKFSEISYDELKQELDECRRNGFAHRSIGLSENNMVKLLASAILGADNRPIGSLIIVGLFSRSTVQKYGANVAESARKLSLLLGANVPETRKVIGRMNRKDSKQKTRGLNKKGKLR